MSEPNAENSSSQQGADEHEAFEADFEEYLAASLAPGAKAALEQHLAGCARCREGLAACKDAKSTLSGLHKMAAPQQLEEQVAQTIYRRSGGKFFGRKAFGDRVPFELIALVGLAVALIVVLLMRWSLSGSLHDAIQRHERAPDAGEAAKEAMPRP